MEKHPIEPKAVRVTAADYNPGLIGTGKNPWDGYPFSDQPQWLRRMIEQGLVVPTTINGTDYAEWYVGEDKVLATAGDWIVLQEDGSALVVPGDREGPAPSEVKIGPHGYYIKA